MQFTKWTNSHVDSTLARGVVIADKSPKAEITLNSAQKKKTKEKERREKRIKERRKKRRKKKKGGGGGGKEWSEIQITYFLL